MPRLSSKSREIGKALFPSVGCGLRRASRDTPYVQTALLSIIDNSTGADMNSDTTAVAGDPVAEILELDEGVDFADPDIRARMREALEAGNVLFLKGRGFV